MNRILAVLAILAAIQSCLLASPGRSSAASVTLVWTAPGDDGLTGQAALYDLRYSEQPLTPENFLQATRAAGLPQPAAPGTTQTHVLQGLEAGVVYYLAIRTADHSGNWSAMSNVITRVPQEAFGDPVAAPLAFSAPWPNPASLMSRLNYSLPDAARIRVEVFDVAGRRVRVLADELRNAGPGELAFDLTDDHGTRLAGGVYLVRALLGAAVFTRRLVIAR